MGGGPPRIDEWKILNSGAVRGIVSNHPELPDGYEITTSPLDTDTSSNNKLPKNNAVVATLSGSKYRLLTGIVVAANGNGNSKASKSNSKSKPTKAKPKAAAKTKPAAKKPTKPTTSNKTDNTIDYNLNGKVVGGRGDTRYLLVGTQIRSSSKRSQIYYAYEADTTTNNNNNNNAVKPNSNRLTVKLTANRERLGGESRNYDRVFSRGRVAFSLQGSGSCFVRKVAFLENDSVDSSEYTRGVPTGSSALVLESGDTNLREHLNNNNNNGSGAAAGGLTGKALRRAAVSVCQCVEAMHSSGLVWTDLKAENFVLQTSGGNSGSGNNNDNNIDDYTVKGIDLESAVAIGAAPEDYSPEACPPEFAAAERAGRGYDFECLKNYDSWSVGMIFYELSTGTNYFRGKSEDTITKILAGAATATATATAIATTSTQLLDGNTGRVRGLDAIPDANMRDLVDKCLDTNPNKRPSIGQILLHPYFLTTGLGPFTF